MDFWIDLIWRGVIVVVVTAAITFVWTFASIKFASLNRPYRISEAGGVIRPWPPIWLLMGGFTGVVCAGGVWASIAEPSMAWVSIACLAILAPLAAFGVLMGLPSARVSWDVDGVEGPSSSLGFGGGKVSWTNIVRTGTTLSGCHFVEDHEGRRVFWSTAYIGQHFLWNAIAANRPDLLKQIRKAIAASG